MPSAPIKPSSTSEPLPLKLTRRRSQASSRWLGACQSVRLIYCKSNLWHESTSSAAFHFFGSQIPHYIKCIAWIISHLTICCAFSISILSNNYKYTEIIVESKAKYRWERLSWYSKISASAEQVPRNVECLFRSHLSKLIRGTVKNAYGHLTSKPPLPLLLRGNCVPPAVDHNLGSLTKGEQMWLESRELWVLTSRCSVPR